jgi:myosin heavy subunit
LELYKQLEFDQLLSKVIQKLSQMAEQQNRLGDKTSLENANLTQLKNEQNALNEKFNELKVEFSELTEKNEDLEQKNDFDGSQKDLSQISQDLKESLDNLNEKEPKKASVKQTQAVSKMQELSDKLKKMQEDEEEQENEINKNELRQLLENLLSISFEQEKIMKDLRGISTINPDYVLKIQKQKNIQVNFKLIEDSLYSLSKRIPQIQSLANKEVQQINLNIKTALENLADRKTAEANRDQQYTMTSINNLALMLNEVLDQLEKSQQNGKSGGKGKKKQSLSQLSKMQEQLNKNMQKAKEEMQKQGQESPAKQGKGSMSEAFAKMAREQQLIRQSMQELNRMENKDGKRSLGNLEEIIKEMEQSETDLVNKRIKQETVIRQQEILSKLLEAERAENERDEEEKRESAEGKNQVPINSKIMLDYLKNKEKETDLLKTISPSFNLYYKIKVGDYFRLLNSGNK